MWGGGRAAGPRPRRAEPGGQRQARLLSRGVGEREQWAAPLPACPSAVLSGGSGTGAGCPASPAFFIEKLFNKTFYNFHSFFKVADRETIHM